MHRFVDVAALYEVGKVSPTAGGLNLRGAAQTFGGGVRVHTKTSGLLRLDLAGSSEGIKLSVGFSGT